MTTASKRAVAARGWGAALGLALVACTGSTGGGPPATQAGAPGGTRVAYAGREQVMFGRQLVIQHDCGGCHGGGADPASPRWLSGMRGPADEFRIGPCAVDPAARPCFITRPRNLTPDNQTGLGRFSERQIFNALRYGLRPGETPDVEITSSVPGQGNFPDNPKYLAPPMPWTAWRHMPDEQLWAIAAYLKHGVKPVRNQVADSEGPPDFWRSAYTVEEIGPYPARGFPTANEEYRP
jgi:mono/diheme cytochrome c family protein